MTQSALFLNYSILVNTTLITATKSGQGKHVSNYRASFVRKITYYVLIVIVYRMIHNQKLDVRWTKRDSRNLCNCFLKPNCLTTWQGWAPIFGNSQIYLQTRYCLM